MFREHEKSVRSVRGKLRDCDRLLSEFESFLRSATDNRRRSLIEHGEIEGRGFSISEVVSESRRTARAILSLRNTRLANLSSERINNILSTSSALNSSAQALDAARVALSNENRSYSFETGGKVVTFLSKEEMYNFGPMVEELFSNLEALRSASAGLALISADYVAENETVESISELASRASALLRQAQEAADAILASRESAEEKLSEFSELSTRLTSDADSLAEKSRETGASVAALGETAAAAVESIRGHEEQISSRRSHIHELSEAAETDRAKLADFSAELAEIETRMQKLAERATEDKARQDEYLADAENLIARAEDMVSGATVAGLAKAFDEERSGLQKGMDNAMLWFFVGIAFLFVVTFLLAAYVFEIPFALFGIQLSGDGATEAVGDEVTVAGVLSRTIILLAPFWLTLFSARRYRNLFDLRQQYSHKYNLAFSIDGFRKQAPSYGEDLAAWVFHEISQRPITGNSRKLGENPVPTLEAIVAATIERTNFFKNNRQSSDRDEQSGA